MFPPIHSLPRIFTETSLNFFIHYPQSQKGAALLALKSVPSGLDERPDGLDEHPPAANLRPKA